MAGYSTAVKSSIAIGDHRPREPTAWGDGWHPSFSLFTGQATERPAKPRYHLDLQGHLLAERSA